MADANENLGGGREQEGVPPDPESLCTAWDVYSNGEPASPGFYVRNCIEAETLRSSQCNPELDVRNNGFPASPGYVQRQQIAEGVCTFEDDPSLPEYTLIPSGSAPSRPNTEDRAEPPSPPSARPSTLVTEVATGSAVASASHESAGENDTSALHGSIINEGPGYGQPGHSPEAGKRNDPAVLVRTRVCRPTLEKAVRSAFQGFQAALALPAAWKP